MSQRSTFRIRPMTYMRAWQQTKMTAWHLNISWFPAVWNFFICTWALYLIMCSSVLFCVCFAISEITDVLLKTKVATLWQYFNLFWSLFIHYEEVLHTWFCTSRCCCTFAPMNGHVAGGSCAVFPAVLLCQCIIYRVFHKEIHNFTVSSLFTVWYLETLFFSHTKSWQKLDS